MPTTMKRKASESSSEKRKWENEKKKATRRIQRRRLGIATLAYQHIPSAVVRTARGPRSGKHKDQNQTPGRQTHSRTYFIPSFPIADLYTKRLPIFHPLPGIQAIVQRSKHSIPYSLRFRRTTTTTSFFSTAGRGKLSIGVFGFLLQNRTNRETNKQ